MRKDVTNRVERLEALEDRFNVSIEAVSAVYEESGVPAEYPSRNGYLDVYYDLHSRDGGELSQSLKITLAVYDGDGKLVALEEGWHQAENFFGVESTKLVVGLDGETQIAKIRLYPGILG
jgi:hypothetical protein